jgi:hypothetical protein
VIRITSSITFFIYLKREKTTRSVPYEDDLWVKTDEKNTYPTIESLLTHFFSSIVDISLNEHSVNWVGHSIKLRIFNPLGEFLQCISE